jgi:two-component system, OmpR family, response regulator ResD
MLVFIVEREEAAATFLSSALQEAGFSVQTFNHTTSSLQAVVTQEPALIIFSDLASLQEWEAKRTLRPTKKIVLSARTREGENVRALDSGADDFVAKPLSARELVARVRSVLRGSLRPANEVLHISNLSIDVDARRAWSSGQELELTAIEFNLLVEFARHPDRIFGRKELGVKLWPGEEDGRRIMDVYIHRLRQKIEADPSHPLMLVTCRGDGYMVVSSSRRHQGVLNANSPEAD